MPHVGPMADATYITPDCLLAYCSTRLRDLDESMQKQFHDQQQGIADASSLQSVEQKIKDTFNGLKKDDSGKLTDDFNLDDKTSDDIQLDIDNIKDPSAKATAQKALDSFKSMKKGQTFDDLKSNTLDALDNGRQCLSQGSELGMIGLQSLMSQRQTAVQLTTNLIQALGETSKAVAGNVGK
jgi:hypothetical protein